MTEKYENKLKFFREIHIKSEMEYNSKFYNNTIYKSILSSILSILIIVLSVIFGIYSLINYINQKPMIDYYKNNDFNTNKTIAISDSFIMFQIVSIGYDNLTIKNMSYEYNITLMKQIM